MTDDQGIFSINSKGIFSGQIWRVGYLLMTTAGGQFTSASAESTQGKKHRVGSGWEKKTTEHSFGVRWSICIRLSGPFGLEHCPAVTCGSRQHWLLQILHGYPADRAEFVFNL